MLIRIKSLLVPAIVCLFVSTLLFAKQISVYLGDRNRFFLMWETSDALAMIVLVFSIAFGVLCIGVVVARWPGARRTYDHLLVLALANGLLSTLPINPDSVWIGIFWIGISIAVGYSLASANTRLILYAKNFCLYGSALVPLLFAQLLLNGNWESPEQVPDYRANDVPANPVYFFVFDGMSYEQTTKNGEVLASLENLRNLANRSVTFRNARSPSTRTEVSLPALIYQQDVDETLRGEAVWAALEGHKSIFDLARDNGYNTALVGYYIPYSAVIGDKLDYAFISSHYPKGCDFASKLKSYLIRNLEYLKDPISRSLSSTWLPSHYSRHWHEIGVDTFERSLAVIAQSPLNTLALFHLPLPHWPFASNPDGSYFGYEGEVSDLRGVSGRAGYRRHLLYVDAMIGRIVALLETSGKYDESLFIVTSDHGARTESWQDENRFNVPLIIKMPKQKEPLVIEREVYNWKLRSLIEAVLRGKGDAAQAALEALGD